MMMVVKFGWRLGFSFEMKLAWGDAEGCAPTLYWGVGRVRKD
jgi:hypothetical protein